MVAGRSTRNTATAMTFLAIVSSFMRSRGSTIRHSCIQIQLQHKNFACGLTPKAVPANTLCMAQTFLIFDFGKDEDAAQQARHRIDGWRQGFRLDKKLQLKFDRNEPNAGQEAPTSKTAKGNSTPKAEAKRKGRTKPAGDNDVTNDSKSANASDLRLIVRLDFSDHEKLSHHRWAERIPSEELFKDAKPKIVRTGDPEFAEIAEHFDSLD